MDVLVLAKVAPTEANFESEAVDYVEFLPQRDLRKESGTRAAPSLSFCTVKQQSLNEKNGQLFFMSIGKTCSLRTRSLPLQP